MIRAAVFATTMLVICGCGVREGGTIAVKSEMVTLHLDKQYFDAYIDRIEHGPGNGPDPEPDSDRYRLLYKGSRLRVMETLPDGYMVTVESAIQRDTSRPGPDQYHEDPTLKGKVGWVGKRELSLK
ncbi:hypothetical protein ACYOEI_22620 [Singulisphaera rosea]